jgi:hypothetical protein
LEASVTDWRFAQKTDSEELAQLHHFTFKKCQGGGQISFLITVREYVVPPPGQHARFFAEADKMVNQKVAPFLPSGWGNSLLSALSDCTRIIRQFPCEDSEAGAGTA